MKTCFQCLHLLCEGKCANCQECEAAFMRQRPGWEDRKGESMPQPYHPPAKGAAA